MQPKIELAKSRDFGEIINDTFVFIKQNLKPLLKYFFTFCGIFIVAGTVSLCMMQIKITGLANGVRTGAFDNQYRPSFFDFMGIEFFTTILLGLLSITAVIVTIFCYMILYKEKNNQVPTTEEMWAYIKYYFFKILGSYLLTNIILFVAFFFCFVPMVYLSPIMALILPIMVMENTSFGYAFNRSFILVKENWWATFGVMFVTWIIFSVCRTIFVLPASIINIATTLTNIKGGNQQLSVASAVVASVLQQICQVFLIIPIVSLCLCYFNLTESKDGTSLLERISKLGSSSPDNNLPVEEY